MTDWKAINAEMRAVTRKHLAASALRIALQSYPWYWYFTSEARTERDLMRWADDGGSV
jgi:hypothetical protein